MDTKPPFLPYLPSYTIKEKNENIFSEVKTSRIVV